MSELEITEKEYFEKKLEVAKSLLPAMVAKVTEEYLQDKRKRASLLYNCVAISEDLLLEAGFKMKKTIPLARNTNLQDRRKTADAPVKPALKIEQTQTDIGDRTAIRKLSEMLPSGTK